MPRLSVKGLALLFVPAVIVLLLVASAAVHYRIPVGSLTRDMAAVAGVTPLTGVLSNLGILLWCASAAVSLFTAAIMKGRSENRQALFLAGFGFLTFILMLDDLFMFHDYFSTAALGLRERYVLTGYLALTACLLAAFRKEIFESEFFLLALGLSFFALSVGLDRVPHGDSWLFFVEDGAKFLGLVGWAGYFIRHSYGQLVAVNFGAEAFGVAPRNSLSGTMPAPEGAVLSRSMREGKV